MERLLQVPTEELVITVALLAIGAVIAVYLLGKIRARTVQQEPGTSELLSKFREMHSRGELSEEEFRTIKTKLAVQLRIELKDNGETG
jgi:uncharacterized membrane protein